MIPIKSSGIEQMFPDIKDIDNGTIEGMLKDLREKTHCPCCDVRQLEDPGRTYYTRTDNNRLVPACDQMQEYLKKANRPVSTSVDIKKLLETAHRVNERARDKARRVLAILTDKPQEHLRNEDVKLEALRWREVLTA